MSERLSKLSQVDKEVSELSNLAFGLLLVGVTFSILLLQGLFGDSGIEWPLFVIVLIPIAMALAGRSYGMKKREDSSADVS